MGQPTAGRWLSGYTLALRSKGREFDTHWPQPPWAWLGLPLP